MHGPRGGGVPSLQVQGACRHQPSAYRLPPPGGLRDSQLLTQAAQAAPGPCWYL